MSLLQVQQSNLFSNMIFHHPRYNLVRSGLLSSKDLSSIIILSSREMYWINNFAMHMPILS
jgi:hypothetical protein